jgi:hydrogenase expression/formation protein HypE
MAQTFDISQGLACPLPFADYKNVLLAHGGGGKLTQQLIQKMFLPQFDNELLSPLHDGAVFGISDARVAFSTDSYVVNPIFFPGGSIGDLAVNGTVNDLAMCGASPRYLSAAFIIEEGLPMDDLWKIVLAMKDASRKAGVLLVTGDTKVVDRGKGDQIFITTSGIGIVGPGVNVNPRNASPGDFILLNGSIGLHGIAVMSVREGLEFGTKIESDTVALHGLTQSLLERAGSDIHVLRDPTRGGVASAVNEIAESAQAGITLDEEALPLTEEVRGACEMLGLDPLYVANEGKVLAFVAPASTEKALATMRAHPLGKDAALIGRVTAEHPGVVVMKSTIGGSRVVQMLSGEQLPRIC